MRSARLGILRETKEPPDRRVPLTPAQCAEVRSRNAGLEILVQPSAYRCFPDEDYRAAGLPLEEDLRGCDVLLGVKEVKIDSLIPGKTYLFFSHTAKRQPYNRSLLRAVVKKGIRLLDYEYLTRPDGQRVVAFGRWAGVVGAYNGLRALGLRRGSFDLRPASRCEDLEDLRSGLGDVDLEGARIVLTGGGRVAGGACEILDAAGVERLSPGEFLERERSSRVYARLDPWHYASKRDGGRFEFAHFVEHPESYDNAIEPWLRTAQMFIPCHFWDPRSPVMLTREFLLGGRSRLEVVADISCDIDGPVASTIRASSIAEPFYGYDPVSGNETDPFRRDAITVMAVDNLPGELPRDASEDFGRALTDHVLPELLGQRDTGMIDRACIAGDGALTRAYSYLQDYLEGRE